MPVITIPFFVNPYSRESTIGPKAGARLTARAKKRRSTMKRRRLYGAAATAHARKVGRLHRRRTRRNVPPDPKGIGAKKVRIHHPKASYASRRRHYVTRYHRTGGAVAAYRRKPSNVGGHWSNPRHRRRSYRRNPFGIGDAGSFAMDAVMMVSVALIAVAVAGFINQQVEKVPYVNQGWPNVLAKLAVALGLGGGAFYLARTPQGRKLAAAATVGAAMQPAISAVVLISPQAAPYIIPGYRQTTASAVQQVAASLRARLGYRLSAAPGPRISDSTLAKVEADRSGMETEQSAY
jgi:hypothetical protein